MGKTAWAGTLMTNRKLISGLRLPPLSLGATRDFQLRDRITSKEKISLALADGDLLVMHPGCQSRWMHSVPQRRKVQSTRINLTFRRFQN